MAYLFWGYAVIFGLIAVYLFSLMNRQRALEREIENVKRVLDRNR